MLAKREPLDESWRPSDDEIAQYQRDGWIITPRILSDDLLDEAWAGIERFLVSDSSTIDPVARASDLRRRNGDPIDHVGYMYLEVPEIRRLLSETALGAAAARLAGAAGIRLFHDRLLLKPAQGRHDATIGWHVDRAYWFACTSEAMLTAWIPFCDIDASMGPLQVFSGSHRWPDLPLIATAHRSDMNTLLPEAASRRDVGATALLMQRGQVSFHNCRTLHGSHANLGPHARPALAVHLQPADNRHRLVILPDGRKLAHTNDVLCRSCDDGTPDYSDPAVFPLLWGED